MIRWLLSVVLLASMAHAQTRGYTSRACGLDMNRNGIIGECSNHSSIATCPDCMVCNGQGGVTSRRDVDGDGQTEAEIYVACGSGTDNATCGDPNAPCNTINFALNTRAPSLSGQKIVCFRGTCSSEDQIRTGPNGISTTNGSWPAGVSASCNTNPYYTRTKAGNEVRDFRYPCNPTMLIGWDFNNNGDYPPHDTADTAVINGAGKLGFLSVPNSGSPMNYQEFAHFTFRDYGRDDLGAPTGDQQVIDMSGADQSSTNVYFHDLEDINGDRGNSFANQADIQWAIWNTFWTYLSLENILCQDCGGYLVRGSSDDLTGYGPFRFKNLTWVARGGSSADGGGAIGSKTWGSGTGYEWIDNKWDFNLANWTPGDYHYSHCLNVDQCEQSIDVINNEFIDCFDHALQLHGDGGSSFCQARPIDNSNILRNIFRNTRVIGGNSCCTNFIKIQGAEAGSPSSAYVNAVTIADNFFSSTQLGDNGYTAAILSASARNGATVPGTINIVNNTFDGNFQANRNCGCSRGDIATNNEDGTGTPANNYVIRNNVFSGMDGVSRGSPGVSTRAINVQTSPSNFLADFNYYDPDALFIWQGGSEQMFSTWRANLGGCPGTDNDCNSTNTNTCTLSYVNTATGDFHLTSSDTCARQTGTDQSAPLGCVSGSTCLDIDKDIVPQGANWQKGADAVAVGGTTTTTSTSTSTSVPSTTSTSSTSTSSSTNTTAATTSTSTSTSSSTSTSHSTTSTSSTSSSSSTSTSSTTSTSVPPGPQNCFSCGGCNL
jgi:hypothetical protein